MESARINNSRLRLSCVTENLQKAAEVSTQAISKNLEPNCNDKIRAIEEDCYYKDLSEDSKSYVIRPELYLFPRANPDTPFTPLPTRRVFRRDAEDFDEDYGFESDSDSSVCYDSSEDEEETGKKNGLRSNQPKRSIEIRFPVRECNEVSLNEAMRSKLQIEEEIPRPPRTLKSALKTPRLGFPASPVSSECFSSSYGPSLSSSCSSPRSGLMNVKVIEPVEEILELKELRKSFRYKGDRSSSSPLSLKCGLPSTPRDGLKVHNFLSLKTFQRTPPATSSIARLEWERELSNFS